MVIIPITDLMDWMDETMPASAAKWKALKKILESQERPRTTRAPDTEQERAFCQCKGITSTYALNGETWCGTCGRPLLPAQRR